MCFTFLSGLHPLKLCVVLFLMCLTASVSKKKPTKERILKFMGRSNSKLQEELLQMLLNKLEEEGILENFGDDSSQCFYL